MTTPVCCACGSARTTLVLDLGSVPPADVFPAQASGLVDPVAEDPRSPLAMMLCSACALAQIVADDTAPEVPRGLEPDALVQQAEASVRTAVEAGWIAGSTMREFPSPHGGTWLHLLADRGFVEASDGVPSDVVLDSFGVMHEADQRAAWRARADATAADGVLLLQVHTLAAIVQSRQWTALRHGHAAYYCLTSLQRLLAAVGMSVVDVATFPLYGDGVDGTLLVAARHGHHRAGARAEQVLAHERELGVADPARVAVLQDAVDHDVRRLRDWLTAARDAGTSVLAYGAASRTVALFALAGLDTSLVGGVADGSVAKQGRRMPGTDVPILAPGDLVDAEPDLVYLTLPDLLPELRASWPRLEGRWTLGPDAEVSR